MKDFKTRFQAVLNVATPVLLVAILLASLTIAGMQSDILSIVGVTGQEPAVRAMAWGDYYKSVQEQLAMLVAGTEEDGTAIPDRPITLDSEVVSVVEASATSILSAVDALSMTISGTELQVDIVADGAGLATSAKQLADGHNVTVDNTDDITVTLDGEVVDVTTSVDFTVTLDSEVVSVDVTNTDDITVTLDGETVTVDSELAAAAALADGAANPTVPTAGAGQLLYNNTTWDRERNNYVVTAYASAARTTSGWVEMTNYNARGAYIVVNITGIGADQTMTVSAQVYDLAASGQQETIWSSAALTPTGRHTYLIYPGAGAAAEDVVETVSYPLPRLWNLSTVLNNSEPITFSIGVHYIN